MGSKGGSQVVTIADGVGQPTAQLCKKAYLSVASTNSGDIRVTIDTACTETTGIPLPKSADDANNIISLEVENLNQLNFWGDEDDDVIDILWVY